MSRTRHKGAFDALRRKAPLFSALGDETRLTLLMELGEGRLLSITRLTKGSALTRQAVTKHLRVLEKAGLVRSDRRGRESVFGLEPDALAQARETLDHISQQWDQALARLKAMVEE